MTILDMPFSALDVDARPRRISDSTVVAELNRLVELGILNGQAEFEAAAVDMIAGHTDDPRGAWRTFYENSLADLTDGSAPFAPIHDRARSLLVGDSVLEVGSCFGFFALASAVQEHAVTACDISPGALDLLTDAAVDLQIPVDTVVGDARALPIADQSFDTVTLLHLLEHLSPDDVHDAIAEAMRVARARVVIAVPYEETPTEQYGHLHSITSADLDRWASTAQSRSGVSVSTEVFDFHGGWLVIDVR